MIACAAIGGRCPTSTSSGRPLLRGHAAYLADEPSLTISGDGLVFVTTTNAAGE